LRTARLPSTHGVRVVQAGRVPCENEHMSRDRACRGVRSHIPCPCCLRSSFSGDLAPIPTLTSDSND
jgi:hypothetical protein